MQPPQTVPLLPKSTVVRLTAGGTRLTILNGPHEVRLHAVATTGSEAVASSMSGWCEAMQRAMASGAAQTFEAALHPWNHAPRQLPQTAFAEMCAWHCHALRAQHAHIRDALSGRSLDVLEQCVAIEVESSGEHELTGIGDALGLARALQTLHEARCDGAATEAVAGVLLTAGESPCAHMQMRRAHRRSAHHRRAHRSSAHHRRAAPPKRATDARHRHPMLRADRRGRCAGPAAGKTSLLSQVVVHLLSEAGEAGGSLLVPILVKVQMLQVRLASGCPPQSPTLTPRGIPHRQVHLSEGGESFAAAANWIDAYLRAEYGASSARYRTLRQAILSHRVVLLLDGPRHARGVPWGLRVGYHGV